MKRIVSFLLALFLMVPCFVQLIPAPAAAVAAAAVATTAAVMTIAAAAATKQKDITPSAKQRA